MGIHLTVQVDTHSFAFNSFYQDILLKFVLLGRSSRFLAFLTTRVRPSSVSSFKALMASSTSSMKKKYPNVLILSHF
jgi:hypothetical protein